MSAAASSSGSGGGWRWNERVRLERQVIERQMRRRERKRSGEIRARGVHRLLRQRVHEIEVHVAEDHQRGFRGAPRLVGVVHAAQRLQRDRVEALDAERQPVHAGAEEIGEFLPLERAGIGLERHLGIGQQRHARANAREQPVDGGRAEEARRAAADEHRDDLAAPDRRQRKLQVGQQRIDVGVLRHVAARFVRVEVAVRTLADAPWDVHVERERRQHREVRPGEARGRHRDRRAHDDAAGNGRTRPAPAQAAPAAPASPGRDARSRSCARAAAPRR